jgi:hypothetical protein
VRQTVLAGALVATLLLVAWPSRANPEDDAAFLAKATINDTTLQLMRSIMMPLTQSAMATPHEGRLLTDRAKKEYLAIFDEQFDYLMRKDMLVAQEQVYLKLYTPDELEKIRALFESEAWAVMQARTQAHQSALLAATAPMSDTISKYVMARLETRARDEKFAIWEEPGVLQRLQNVLGSEKP